MSSERLQSVVVVGAGLAGLVAATRAAELGLAVTVLERGGGIYPCNSRFSSGVLHVAYRDIAAPREELVAGIAAETAQFTTPEIAEAVAETAGRALGWVREHGARVIRVLVSGRQRYILAPPRRGTPGGLHPGQGGDVLMRALAERLTALGGRIVLGAKARAIGLDAGSGAYVDTDTASVRVRYGARAVVIADGGFQGNAEMIRQHIAPCPEKVVQRGAGTGTGDGMRMAAELGAATTGLDRFYGHLLARTALKIPALWPYPCLDGLAVSGILVDRNARRIADEGYGGIYLANVVAALEDPTCATAVFDDAAWTGPARTEMLGPNPHLVNAGGELFQANDLHTLAAEAGLPVDALETTVAAYNAAVSENHADRLTPPRSAGRYLPQPIARPPYYAAPLCVGITYTMGGLMIDADARVLRADRTPLPGLYAVGSAAGGIEGGPFAGYVGGLSKAFIFGLRAAESIAREGA